MSFMRFKLLLLALPLSILIAKASNSDAPIVHIASGSLLGKLQGSTNVFEGIPFAAPPLGNLRWREPQPVASWSGTRDATRPSRPCVQSAAGVDNFIAPLAEAYGSQFPIELSHPSEDCLYLNVFSPLPSGHRTLPVMVWLHGGSNRVGTGSDESYNGSSLASHGIIVVTLNYRLGVMGFFSHPELKSLAVSVSAGGSLGGVPTP